MGECLLPHGRQSAIMAATRGTLSVPVDGDRREEAVLLVSLQILLALIDAAQPLVHHVQDLASSLLCGIDNVHDLRTIPFWKLLRLFG
jgi:hypothetical protein